MMKRFALVVACMLVATASGAAPKNVKPKNPTISGAALVTLMREASAGAKIPRGATITGVRPSSIEVAPYDAVTAVVTPPARKAGTITTPATLVFTSAGAIVARAPVTIEIDVPASAVAWDCAKGAPLVLVVQRGLVEVTSQAVAGADADVGDQIPVMLRPSGRILKAQLTAKDRAVAVEGAQ